jgi:hypothetical protein
VELKLSITNFLLALMEKEEDYDGDEENTIYNEVVNSIVEKVNPKGKYAISGNSEFWKSR